MAKGQRVAEYPSPSFEEIPPSSEWLVGYDSSSDTLHIHFGRPRAAVSVDGGDNVWIRIEPLSGAAVGLEIENFERGFSSHGTNPAPWQSLAEADQVRLAADLVRSVKQKLESPREGADRQVRQFPEEMYPLGRPIRPVDVVDDIYGLWCGDGCAASNPCTNCLTSIDQFLRANDGQNSVMVAKLLEIFRALNEVCLARAHEGVFFTSLIGPRNERWFEAVSSELAVMVDKVMELGIEYPQNYEPGGHPIQHRLDEFLAGHGEIEFFVRDPATGEFGAATPEEAAEMRAKAIRTREQKRKSRLSSEEPDHGATRE